MASRFRHLRVTSRVLTQALSGNCYEKCGPEINSWALSRVARSNSLNGINEKILTRELHSKRLSSSSKLPKNSASSFDVLSFIKSTLDQPEGPNHFWLNKREDTNLFKQDGMFLILAGHFLEGSSTKGCQSTILFENVKLLKQRFPQINIIGFQSGGVTCSAAARSSLIQLILKENITFPILLSDKIFHEVSNGACYILFKDFKNPVFYHTKDLDFEVLNKAVEQFHEQHIENSRSPVKLFNLYSKQDEIVNEPDLCSMRNLLLCLPGFVSADKDENRLFISDCNHHRIIVSNCNGKILDSIGSSPGFEDGDFESSKLMRPAASYYDAYEDCLYIVDSENHAIRKADMERRVLETLIPACTSNRKGSRILGWFMEKLGWEINDDKEESEVTDVQAVLFPWHMMKSSDGNLLVMDESFKTLWIVNRESGEIEEVIKGFSNILEICGQQITEKVSLLKQMPHDWLQHQADAACSPEELPYAGLASSFAKLEDQLFICDRVGQRILTMKEEHKISSNVQFSNFGVLGLPYWFQPRLERAYIDGGLQETQIDHVQCFSLMPGRVDIQLNVNVPVGTKLVENLQERCIWRQARGVATLATEAEDETGPIEKVGSAQKWYDELDSLAFSTPTSESVDEGDNKTSTIKFQDDKVHISTAVDTSPGTSEVIITAVLHLKLQSERSEIENNQEKYACRIMDLLSSGSNGSGNGKIERDSCIQFLLKSNRDLRDLIFMKPLHVRIKLESFDHPKDRDTILTESSIEVNVSL